MRFGTRLVGWPGGGGECANSRGELWPVFYCCLCQCKTYKHKPIRSPESIHFELWTIWENGYLKAAVALGSIHIWIWNWGAIVWQFQFIRSIAGSRGLRFSVWLYVYLYLFLSHSLLKLLPNVWHVLLGLHWWAYFSDLICILPIQILGCQTISIYLSSNNASVN